MIERRSDLWEMHRAPGHLVCISTNGFVKKNGCAVMGRGCAWQATQIHLGIAKMLGDYIRKNGNEPGILQDGEKWELGILPVKHNWWEKADLDLIRASVSWLNREARREASNLQEDWGAAWTTFHVPRLGCGNGGRDWEKEVRPLMLDLPDNVVVHS